MGKVTPSGENFEKCNAICGEINILFNKLAEETGGMSMRHHMIKNKNFQTLVEKGDILVNYIFHLMFQHGNCWRYLELLPRIVKDPPKLPNEIAGDFQRQTIFWMQWYMTSDYRKEDNIYHNFIND